MALQQETNNKCSTVNDIIGFLKTNDHVIKSLNTILSEPLSGDELGDFLDSIINPHQGYSHNDIKNLIHWIDNIKAQEYIRLFAKENKLVKRFFNPTINETICKILYGEHTEESTLLYKYYNDEANQKNIDFLLQFDSFEQKDGKLYGTVEGANGTSKTYALIQTDWVWMTIGDPIEQNPLRMDGLDRIQATNTLPVTGKKICRKTEIEINTTSQVRFEEQLEQRIQQAKEEIDESIDQSFSEYLTISNQLIDLKDEKKLLLEKLGDIVQPIDNIVSLINQQYNTDINDYYPREWSVIYKRREKRYENFDGGGMMHLEGALEQIIKFADHNLSSQGYESTIKTVSSIANQLIMNELVKVHNQIYNLQQKQKSFLH